MSLPYTDSPCDDLQLSSSVPIRLVILGSGPPLSSRNLTGYSLSIPEEGLAGMDSLVGNSVIRGVTLLVPQTGRIVQCLDNGEQSVPGPGAGLRLLSVTLLPDIALGSLGRCHWGGRRRPRSDRRTKSHRT